MKPKKPPFARRVKAPKSVQPLVEAIRAQTRKIDRLEKHLSGQTSHFRDTRSRKDLEIMINQRAGLLQALRERDPAKAEELEWEIKNQDRNRKE